MFNIRTFLLKFGPSLVVSAVVLWLCVVNFKSGTWLTGWDNLHPEFDFWMNVSRSLSSTWKSFQGVGAVSGVAAAAELPRQLLLWIMSFIIPAQHLRYVWTFLLLLIGGLGAIHLTHHTVAAKLTPKHKLLASTAAGLFYILNLGTLQQFAVPFESFTTQFAVLPWLILTTWQWVTSPKTSKFFWMLVSIIFFTPAAYVPTIFIVSAAAVGLLLFGEFLSTPHQQKISVFIRCCIVVATFFLLNSYWLLPFGYYVFTNGQATANSTINTFASLDARLSNQEYGTWADIALLRGFLFEYVDAKAGGSPDLAIAPWTAHLSSPFIQIIGFALFGVGLVGIWFAFKTKTPTWTRFAVLGLLSIFMLKSYNPPLGWLFSAVSTYLPFFGEIFRYTFTKFVTIAALVYSLFFGLGIVYVYSLLEKKRALGFVKNLTPVFTVLLLSALMFPALRGSFFSPKNQVAIPSEYFQVMEYFKTQPTQARIATLPQYSFWGWDIYTWGYRGSGWWRHGIEQPLLERTHDVWSPKNENYYKELSQAIYTQNQAQFAAVLDKYHVGWLLLDNNLNYSNDKAIADIKRLIAQNGDFAAEPIIYGKIELYPRANVESYAQSFVTSTPTVATSQQILGKPDSIFENEGSYVTQPTAPTLWPFANAVFERRGNTLVATAPLSITPTPTTNSQIALTTRNYVDTEQLLPVTLFAKKSGSNLTIKLDPQMPSISLGSQIQSIASASASKEVTLTAPENENTFFIQIAQLSPLKAENLSAEFKAIGELYVPTLGKHSISLFTTSPNNATPLFNQLTQTTLQNCALSQDPQQSQYQITYFEDFSFSLSAKKATPCTTLKLPQNNTQQLTQLLFAYKSTTTERPEVVLKNGEGTELNIPFLTTTSYSTEWKDTSFFVTDPATNSASPATLTWALNAEASNTEQKIYFKNPVLTTYPLISSAQFQFQRSDFKDSFTFSAASIPTQLTVTTPTLSTYPAIAYDGSSNRNFTTTQNCDPINKGPHSKTISEKSILYTARNSSECDTFDLRQFSTQWSGLLELGSAHESGKPIQFCLTPTATGHCDVISLSDTTKTPATQLFPLYAKRTLIDGYLLNVTNHSIGRVTTKNALNSINVTPYPLGWITSIKLNEPTKTYPPLAEGATVKIHDSLYFVKGKATGNEAIIQLQQAFDPGWKAMLISSTDWKKPLVYFAFNVAAPYLQHLELNSWANAWVVPTQPAQEVTIVIFFWPHIMQQLGLVLVVFTIGIASLGLLFKRKQS